MEEDEIKFNVDVLKEAERVSEQRIIKEELKNFLKTLDLGYPMDYDSPKLVSPFEKVAYVLKCLIQAENLPFELLDIRSNSSIHFNFSDVVRLHNSTNNTEYTANKGSFFILFLSTLLLHIYNSWEDLLESVNNTNDEESLDSINEAIHIDDLIGDCVLLLSKRQLYEKIDFEHNGSNQFIKDFELRLTRNETYWGGFNRITSLNDREKKVKTPRLFPVLYDTLLMIKEDGLLE
ncbi:MAG: hypothetical protein H3C31_12685 [Brumimicrobium sp.]|nr:hypothetical protein [Brumimicrobium sp.]